jgi:hypothetical protein
MKFEVAPEIQERPDLASFVQRASRELEDVAGDSGQDVTAHWSLEHHPSFGDLVRVKLDESIDESIIQSMSVFDPTRLSDADWLNLKALKSWGAHLERRYRKLADRLNDKIMALETA